MFSKYQSIVTPKRRLYYIKKKLVRYNLELMIIGVILLFATILIIR